MLRSGDVIIVRRSCWYFSVFVEAEKNSIVLNETNLEITVLYDNEVVSFPKTNFMKIFKVCRCWDPVILLSAQADGYVTQVPVYDSSQNLLLQFSSWIEISTLYWSWTVKSSWFQQLHSTALLRRAERFITCIFQPSAVSLWQIVHCRILFLHRTHQNSMCCFLKDLFLLWRARAIIL